MKCAVAVYSPGDHRFTKPLVLGRSIATARRITGDV